MLCRFRAHALVAVLGSLTVILPGCAQGGGGLEPLDASGRPRDAGQLLDGGRLDAFVPPLDGGDIDAFVPPLDGGDFDAFVPPVDGGDFDAFVPPLDSGVRADAGGPADSGMPDTSVGNLCTGVDCSAGNTACTIGRCEPLTGLCVTDPVNECSACGGTNVCSGGVCGPAPTTVSYDFESGLPSGWSVGTVSGWIIDGSRVHGGAMAAHSAVIGNSSSSRMTASLTVSRQARVFFWYATGTEPGYDWLEIWVDGMRQARWSGTNDWTQGGADIPAGAHTLEFRYTRDSSGGAAGDRVWIDDVRVESAPLAIDFEGGTSLPLEFTTSGSAAWQIGTAQAHSGTNSAASGSIGDARSSSLLRTITLSSPATMSYWYTVSSESGSDFLELWIDGVRRERAAGEVAWTFTSYPLAAGPHDIEWRYTKDFSARSGSDRAWIDDLITGEVAGTGSICP